MEQEAELRKKINEDTRQAMKAGDTLKRDTLRMLVSSLDYAFAAKQAPLTDTDILGAIAKEVKKHVESIEAFKKGNRPDLVAKEEAEHAILLSYLPKQFTRDEII